VSECRESLSRTEGKAIRHDIAAAWRGLEGISLIGGAIWRLRGAMAGDDRVLVRLIEWALESGASLDLLHST